MIIWILELVVGLFLAFIVISVIEAIRHKTAPHIKARFKMLWLRIKLKFQISLFKRKAEQIEMNFINQVFGLTYASWVVMPRVLMEAMPTEWQQEYADLWVEFYDTWDMEKIYKHGEPYIQLRKDGKYVSIEKTGLPHYRHPGNLDHFKR